MLKRRSGRSSSLCLQNHSTGVSPFEMMYGRKPCKDALPSLTGYEVQDYQTRLKDKLAELLRGGGDNKGCRKPDS